MQVQDVIQLISTVGFPIFACCFLGWYIVKLNEKMTQAISENTQAIIKLIDRLDND